MAAKIGQITCLGTVETAPGIPFWRWIDPTDFDFALENMRVRIKDKYSTSEAWDLLGMFASPLKRWLTLYIELASKYKEPYTPGRAHTWMLRFMDHGYTAVQLQKYFEVFYQLAMEKQISRNIYEPYTYVPAKSDPIVNFTSWIKASTGIITLALAAGIIIYARRK